MLFIVVFLALAPFYALGQKVLYLPVYRAELVLRPLRKLGVKLCRKPQRYLFFIVIRSLFHAAPVVAAYAAVSRVARRA